MKPNNLGPQTPPQSPSASPCAGAQRNAQRSESQSLFLTIAQVAQRFGVTEKTIRRAIKTGEIRAVLLPGNNGPQYRIFAAQFDATQSYKASENERSALLTALEWHGGTLPHQDPENAQKTISKAIEALEKLAQQMSFALGQSEAIQATTPTK